MKVKEIMSSPVETISSDATITQAAEMMKSFDVGVLPVEQEDEVVGTITDRDIVVRIIAKKLDPENTPVSRAMTADPTCCAEDTDMEEAAKMMEEKKIHRLLVLGSDNEIAGVLSIGDIARKMKDEHLLHEVLERVCEPAHMH
jgi:CBS domain-containing protein